MKPILLCGFLALVVSAPFARAIVDANGNLVSDVFERLYFPPPPFVFQPLEDSDADGAINLLEAIAGTNPLSALPPAGVFRSTISRDASNLTLRWPSVLGKQYTLLSSPTLAAESWSPVGTAFSGSGGEMQAVIPTAGLPSKLFYRVGVSDTNFAGGGITEWERLHLPPTATLSDFDGDGLLNNWEIAHNLDPEDATGINGGAGDPDGDGYPNTSEQAAGTDPRNALSKPGVTSPPQPPAPPSPAFVPIARYALFPITNVPILEPEYFDKYALQINDRGTVLYEYGTWTGGIWTELAGTNFVNTNTYRGHATSISDTGMILGSGSGAELLGNVMVATSPHDTLTRVNISGAGIVGSDPNGFYPYIYPIITNTNQIIGSAGVPPDSFDYELYIWTLPYGPAIPIPAGYNGMYDSNHYWGKPFGDSKPSLKSNNATISLDITPEKFVPFSNGDFLVSFLNLNPTPNSSAPIYCKVLHNNKLIGADDYTFATDTALDGTAIGQSVNGRFCPIYQNKKWQDLVHTTPQFTNSPWLDGTVELQDTTAHGWIFAQRGTYPAYQYAAMLPLIVEPDQIILPTGLDDVSITATDFGGAAVRDKIWIMAPKGGPVTSVKIKAPLNGQTPLKLSSQGVTFSPDTLTAASTPVTISAGNGALNGDADVTLKFNTAESVSIPIGFKVMPARELKVTVFLVPHQLTNSVIPLNPAMLPANSAAIENFLNDIFRPQINVTFKVNYNVATKTPINWDADNDGFFTLGGNNHSLDQLAVFNSPLLMSDSSNPLIKIYILSKSSGPLGSADAPAVGSTSRTKRTCWVLGSPLTNHNTSTHVLETMAHEIGHVLIGAGHPDLSNQYSPAPLPGTDRTKRLMRSGTSNAPFGKAIVKGEWDEAKTWLEMNP